MGRPAFIKHKGRRVYLPPHPEDACPRKHYYNTELAARMGAQAAITNPTRAHAPKRLWVYPCARCQGWHVSSDGRNERPPVTARDLFAPPADQ